MFYLLTILGAFSASAGLLRLPSAPFCSHYGRKNKTNKARAKQLAQMLLF